MRTFDPRAIADAIASCLPPGGADLHKPTLTDAEADAAANHVRYGIDRYEPVDETERLIAAACGTQYAIAVSSGTMALQVALETLGVRRGDLVLVPSMTFAAVAAAVCHVGAEPVFLDSQDLDLGIAPFKLRRFLKRWKGEPFAAMIAVHAFGLPCRIRALSLIAREWGIPLIEDTCEALGSSDHGRPCGSFGRVGVISTNANKIVTAGAGGAIVTDDEDIAVQARHLATTSRIAHVWLVEHDGIGHNARIPTMCAAVLVPQLQRLAEIIERKRGLAATYQRAVEDMPVHLVTERDNAASNYWLPTLLVDPTWAGGRDEILSALHKRKIRARAAFTPLHRLAPYAGCARDDMTGTDDIWRRAVCLPSSAGELVPPHGPGGLDRSSG